MRLRILLIAILAILLMPVSAGAQSEHDANKLFAEGLRLYVEKDYEEAAKVLEQSYDAKAEQRTLFAWAQAMRLSGNCEESKELLTQYVANGASGKQSRAAFKLMEDCTPKASSSGKDEGSKGKDDSEEPTEDSRENEDLEDIEGSDDALVSGSGSSESDPNDTSHWYTDPVALGLLASGVVGVAVASYSYTEALSIEEEGRKSSQYGEFVDFKKDAEDHRRIAVIAGASGAVLLGAGITYLVLRDSPGGEEEDPSLVLHLGSESAGFAFTGRF